MAVDISSQLNGLTNGRLAPNARATTAYSFRPHDTPVHRSCHWTPPIALALTCTFDGFFDFLHCLIGVAPIRDTGPFSPFKILVVGEEVADLVEQNFGEFRIGVDLGVIGMQIIDRYCDDFFVRTGFIDHVEHTDGPGTDDAARHHGHPSHHQDIERITVFRQSMRHETVVRRVVHRRVQKPVDEHRTRFLIDLVLDRIAAQGDFDDNVQVPWRVMANGDFVDIHDAFSLACVGDGLKDPAPLKCAITTKRLPDAILPQFQGTH